MPTHPVGVWLKDLVKPPILLPMPPPFPPIWITILRDDPVTSTVQSNTVTLWPGFTCCCFLYHGSRKIVPSLPSNLYFRNYEKSVGPFPLQALGYLSFLLRRSVSVLTFPPKHIKGSTIQGSRDPIQLMSWDLLSISHWCLLGGGIPALESPCPTKGIF